VFSWKGILWYTRCLTPPHPAIPLCSNLSRQDLSNLRRSGPGPGRAWALCGGRELRERSPNTAATCTALPRPGSPATTNLILALKGSRISVDE
jgi:hypothetical protein